MRLLISYLILSALTATSCANDSPATVPPTQVVVPEPSTIDTLQPAPVPTSDTVAVQPSPPKEKPVTKPSKDVAPDRAAVDAIEAMPSAPAASKATAPPGQLPASKGDFKRHGFADVSALDASILLDIRYATTSNFTNAKIYDCPRCLLRPDAATALVRAHNALKKKGMGLKMFDCYRPRPYQQRLWDKVPNPDYVTPPAKGSMHSRGAAVDLTIVDAKGKELDMGTPYDFFGREAHTDYTGHSAAVQANRDLLRTTLQAVGFKGIRTEWWHFSYQGKDFPLSNYVWPCN